MLESRVWNVELSPGYNGKPQSNPYWHDWFAMMPALPSLRSDAQGVVAAVHHRQYAEVSKNIGPVLA